MTVFNDIYFESNKKDEISQIFKTARNHFPTPLAQIAASLYRAKNQAEFYPKTIDFLIVTGRYYFYVLLVILKNKDYPPSERVCGLLKIS